MKAISCNVTNVWKKLTAFRVGNYKYTRLSNCKGESISRFPVRYLIVAIVVLSCAVDYITRVNINVAIVSMVKPHEHSHNVSAGTCPFKGHVNATEGQLSHDIHHNANPNLTYEWSPKTQGIILGSFWCVSNQLLSTIYKSLLACLTLFSTFSICPQRYSYMCMQVPSGRMAEETGGKWIVG